MKNRSLISSIITLAIIGYVAYSNIPKYHTFTEGDFELSPNEYRFVEVRSQSASPIRVTTEGESVYDLYLLSEVEFKKLTDWMESDDLNQPPLSCLGKWEGVNSVDEEEIMMPEGLFYLVLDNTLLGTESTEEAFAGSYRLSEKY